MLQDLPLSSLSVRHLKFHFKSVTLEAYVENFPLKELLSRFVPQSLEFPCVAVFSKNYIYFKLQLLLSFSWCSVYLLYFEVASANDTLFFWSKQRGRRSRGFLGDQDSWAMRHVPWSQTYFESGQWLIGIQILNLL